MEEQHFGKAYGGNPPANYERFFVERLVEELPFAAGVTFAAPRFVRVNGRWTLHVAPAL